MQWMWTEKEIAMHVEDLNTWLGIVEIRAWEIELGKKKD